LFNFNFDTLQIAGCFFIYFCCMKEKQIFDVHDLNLLRINLLDWVKDFEVACILDSFSEFNLNNSLSCSNYDLIVAVGVNQEISSLQGLDLSGFEQYRSLKPLWHFGFLTYDLKNHFEELISNHVDLMNWPDYYFFSPTILILIKDHKMEIEIAGNSDISDQLIYKQLTGQRNIEFPKAVPVKMNSRISKNNYLQCVESIKKHILRGDIYEVNYCQEFYSHTEFDPYYAYSGLTRISPMPFSCFFKMGPKFLISASPERFIKKTGNKLISQPIKGTAPRSSDLLKDQFFAEQLEKSEKERAENIMIVDLVRNDLSKIAKNRTVKVDELCGVYHFKQVHQLISTISCELRTNSFESIIRATFPMGSMTGAPKINAMKIAEKYEQSKRGLYSGSVGYITPENDFDFNVVIRSLQYNSKNQYLSYQVGGAITGYSDPSREYEECLLKASAIEELLSNSEND
jgi:para-aminobenzoate synthetase component I